MAEKTEGEKRMQAVADKENKDKEDKEKKEKEEKEAKEKKKEPKQLLLELIASNLRTVHAATAAGDTRLMGRIVRSFANLRRTLTTEVLVKLVDEFVDESRPFKAKFLEYAAIGVDVVMDEPAPPAPKEGEPPAEEKKKIETKFPKFDKPYSPEFEAYALLLVLIRLIDQKQHEKDAADVLVLWLKTQNRRTLDFFTTRAYFYWSMAYERSGGLEQIRAELLAAYRTACLRHDVMGHQRF